MEQGEAGRFTVNNEKLQNYISRPSFPSLLSIIKEALDNPFYITFAREGHLSLDESESYKKLLLIEYPFIQQIVDARYDPQKNIFEVLCAMSV